MSAPRNIGPYELLAPLTKGGMGALARARHRDSGRVVALKFVQNAVRVNIRSLRREIRALQALEHPNVVAILDADPEAAPPWYAMELIDGLPLGRHWRTGQAPERWARYIAIFADICDGLAYMHGMGLVHRDLKPANVIVRPIAEEQREGVLVDFGLATAAGGGVGREQLYKRSEVIGTPSYISPEQVRQQYVDGRADLYALGCMLYELCTGEPPFPSNVPFTGMMHHINTTPVVPPKFEKRLPPPLVELIYALLEKDPSNRPGYATDVRRMLDDLVELPRRSDRPPVRAYLHRADFVGRQAELSRMESVVEALDRGEGGVVVVRGPAGVGKSRVGIELIQQLQQKLGARLTSFVAAGTRRDIATPLGTLRAIFEEIADECIEKGPRFTQELLGPGAPLIGRYLPVIRNIPGVAGVSIENPGSLLESATIDSLNSVIMTSAGRGPLVVAIDDVQWADGLTRRWLRSLIQVQAWTELPILFILIWRDDEGDDLVDRFAQLEVSTTFSVGALERSAVLQLVRSMTGVDEIPEPFLESIEHSARGMPSRVVQWLDASVSRGVLVRSDGQWQIEGRPLEDVTFGSTAVLDVSFDELQSHRFDALGEPARSLLQFLAVLGPAVRAELVEQLSDGEMLQLEQLIADGWLVDAGRGEVRFATDEQHQRTVRQLGVARELHVRAAAVLEAVRAPVIEIARHLAASGWKDEARGRMWKAARDAIKTGDFTSAEVLLLELESLGYLCVDDHVYGLALLAKIHMVRGDAELAEGAIQESVALLDETDDELAQAEVAAARAEIAMHSARYDEAMSALRLARSLFHGLDNWPRERDCVISMGNCYCRRGEFLKGREFFTSVHDEAKERDDPEGVAIGLASAGTVLLSLRQYDAAADFLSRAERSFDGLGLPYRRVNVLQNLGVCQADRGRYGEAAEVFREIMRVRGTMGDVRGRAAAQSMLGHVLLRAGDPDNAIVELTASIAPLERSRDFFSLSSAESYLGEAFALKRQFDSAMEHFLRSLRFHGGLDYSPLEPYVYIEMAKLHRRLGLYVDAHHHLGQVEGTEADRYLSVAYRIERGLLELGANGETTISVDDLSSDVEAMQLPSASSLSQGVERFRRAVECEASQRRHGEFRGDVPPAFAN